MASWPKLLRQVHKAGFWHGAEFGRQVFLEIMENEKKMEVLNNTGKFLYWKVFPLLKETTNQK